MKCELKSMPRRLEFVRVDVHTNAHRRLSQAWDEILAKAMALERPRLVDHIQKVLAVVRDGLALVVDHDGRVVVLGRRRPFVRDVDLFRVAHDDVAVVLEGDGACPEGADAAAFVFEEGQDVLEGFETVAFAAGLISLNTAPHSMPR